jgi:hypothetical protein
MKAQACALDIKKGMEEFGGNAQIYISVLRSYSINTKPILDSMENVEEDSLADYAIIVQGVKGSSQNIFAYEIAVAAEQLEDAAKSGDFAFVQKHNPLFLLVARKLVEDLERVLSPTCQ